MAVVLLPGEKGIKLLLPCLEVFGMHGLYLHHRDKAKGNLAVKAIDFINELFINIALDVILGWSFRELPVNYQSSV